MRKDAGVDGDAQRISQLAWMIFFKVFSDKEQDHKVEAELEAYAAKLSLGYKF